MSARRATSSSRVAAYTQAERPDTRLRAWWSRRAALEEFAVTDTEAEALLLESNLIKRLKPRYNVLLRDDKSFPYIVICQRPSDCPQLAKHRGARDRKGDVFRPVRLGRRGQPHADALQRAFLLRSCSDTRVRHAHAALPAVPDQALHGALRRPHRQPDYASLVDEARGFLAGRSREIQQALGRRMTGRRRSLDFESAALLPRPHPRPDPDPGAPGHQRRRASTTPTSSPPTPAAARSASRCSSSAAARICGNRAYFPRARPQTLERRGAGRVPRPVLRRQAGAAADPAQPATCPSARCSPRRCRMKAGHRVEIRVPQRGEKRKLVEHALANAREALARPHGRERLAARSCSKASPRVFGLDAPPAPHRGLRQQPHPGPRAGRRHDRRRRRRASRRTAYRKFNINGAPADNGGIAAGDDFGMMREVLTPPLRAARSRRIPTRDEAMHWPDLVLIDGGQGQLNAALQVLAELGIDDIAVVGDRQGPRPRRRPRALLHAGPGAVRARAARSGALFPAAPARRGAPLRDRRPPRAPLGAASSSSPLDEIAGHRRRRARKRCCTISASAEAIARRRGSTDLEAGAAESARPLARKIYDHFHSGGG